MHKVWKRISCGSKRFLL